MTEIKPETETDVMVLLGRDYMKHLTSQSFTQEDGSEVVELTAKGKIGRSVFKELRKKIEAMGGQYKYGKFIVPLTRKNDK